MKDLKNINTKKPDLTNITMAGSSFQFNFQVAIGDANGNLKVYKKREVKFEERKFEDTLID